MQILNKEDNKVDKRPRCNAMTGNWVREHKQICDVIYSAPGTFKDGAHNLFIFLFVVDAFSQCIRLKLADMTTQNQPQKKVSGPEILACCTASLRL